MDVTDPQDTIARLGAILAREAETRGWRRASWGWLVHRHWDRVVGGYLAHHTRLVGIDSDGVTIAVPSSGWAQELVYWKPEILRRLAELSPGPDIPRVIRVKVAARLFTRPSSVADAPRERGWAGGSRAHAAGDLAALIQSVRDKHAAAVEHWLSGDYTRCVRCQSPTLKGYRLCATCQYGAGP